MSAGPKHKPRPPLSDDARERLVFALEVGSNDPKALESTRAKAERLLHIQRILARARHSED